MVNSRGKQFSPLAPVLFSIFFPFLIEIPASQMERQITAVGSIPPIDYEVILCDISGKYISPDMFGTQYS